MKGRFQRYGSHIGPLVQAVRQVPGNVLELGTGHYSTQVLHALCCPERKVLSLDTNDEWLAIFRYLECPSHEFHLVSEPTLKGWLSTVQSLDLTGFGLAFVDFWPGTFRIEVADYLIDVVPVIAVHDLSPGPSLNPLSKKLRSVPFIRKFGAVRPGTGFCSKTVDFKEWMYV